MESDDKEQWNEAAESWVKFVRSGKNYHSEYLNGPARALTHGATSKVRNQIARYTTRVFAEPQMLSPNESMEEGE